MAKVKTPKGPKEAKTKKKPTSPPSDANTLVVYLTEVSKLPLLTVEEEQRLARRYRADESGTAGLDAAHTLVTSNLRFVVKIAFEYRSYGFKMVDLIQEGNIGLMKAVQKFDPDRQIRLISYALWWIKAYIQHYILKNWSLVRLGTVQAERKLFFSLARTRRELEKMGVEGADHLNTLKDIDWTSPDVAVRGSLVQEKLKLGLECLDPRERDIIENRLMAESPMTLSELGARYGVSRDRIRRIERIAKQKLKLALTKFIGDDL